MSRRLRDDFLPAVFSLFPKLYCKTPKLFHIRPYHHTHRLYCCMRQRLRDFLFLRYFPLLSKLFLRLLKLYRNIPACHILWTNPHRHSPCPDYPDPKAFLLFPRRSLGFFLRRKAYTLRQACFPCF